MVVGGTFQGSRSTCDLGCAGSRDLDRNGDVDLDDLEVFVTCLSGPGVALITGCDLADFNFDRRIDLRDVAAFQLAFTGPK